MEGIEFQSLGNLRWLASESFVRSIGDLFGIICWVNLWLNWMEICSYPVGNDFVQERARANLEKLKGFNQPSYREDWNKYLVTVCERWCWLRLGLDIDMTIHVCWAIPTPKSHTHSSRERYLTIPVSHNHRMTFLHASTRASSQRSRRWSNSVWRTGCAGSLRSQGVAVRPEVHSVSSGRNPRLRKQKRREDAKEDLESVVQRSHLCYFIGPYCRKFDF